MALLARTVSRSLANGLKPSITTGLSNSVRRMSDGGSDASPEEMDKKAIEVYRKHPRAFCNIPLEEIKFSVGEHFVTKAPAPVLTRDNGDENPAPGILHVTPFAVSVFNFFGPNGNLGRTMNFGNGKPFTITDPTQASQEFGLSANPLACQQGINDLMVDYFEWISDIEKKFCDHLVENKDAYECMRVWSGPIAGLVDDEAMSGKLLDTMGQPFVRTVKHPKDGPPERAFIPFRQRLYVGKKEESSVRMQSPPGEHDELAKHGDGKMFYERKHVPVFDAQGNEIPIPNSKGQSGDIIAVNVNLTTRLFKVGNSHGISLNKNLRSVFRLRQAKKSQSANPFAGMDLS